MKYLPLGEISRSQPYVRYLTYLGKVGIQKYEYGKVKGPIAKHRITMANNGII